MNDGSTPDNPTWVQGHGATAAPGPTLATVHPSSYTPGRSSGHRPAAGPDAMGMVVAKPLAVGVNHAGWSRIAGRRLAAVRAALTIEPPPHVPALAGPYEYDSDDAPDPQVIAWVHTSLGRAIVAAGGGARELARLRRSLSDHMAQVIEVPSQRAGLPHSDRLYMPLYLLTAPCHDMHDPVEVLGLLFYILAELAAVAFAKGMHAAGPVMLAAAVILLCAMMSPRVEWRRQAPPGRDWQPPPALDAPPLCGQVTPTGPPAPGRTNLPRVLPIAA